MRVSAIMLAAALTGLLIISSCKKSEGTGGNSSIRGKIWVKDYPTMTEYAGADKEVYIIYGDEVGYGDRIRASYDGNFEFKYLRKGDYKIYVYSMALTSSQDSAVVINASISEKKQTVDLGKILIYD